MVRVLDDVLLVVEEFVVLEVLLLFVVDDVLLVTETVVFVVLVVEDVFEVFVVEDVFDVDDVLLVLLEDVVDVSVMIGCRLLLTKERSRKRRSVLQAPRYLLAPGTSLEMRHRNLLPEREKIYCS